MLTLQVPFYLLYLDFHCTSTNIVAFDVGTLVIYAVTCMVKGYILERKLQNLERKLHTKLMAHGIITVCENYKVSYNDNQSCLSRQFYLVQCWLSIPGFETQTSPTSGEPTIIVLTSPEGLPRWQGQCTQFLLYFALSHKHQVLSGSYHQADALPTLDAPSLFG